MINRLEKISKLLLEEINVRFGKEPPHFEASPELTQMEIFK
jgi:hypothetical protein